MLTYSCTINISPFKRLNIGLLLLAINEYPCPVQFTKCSYTTQQDILYYALSEVKEGIPNADWGEVVFEPTKRGDPHMHTYFKVKDPIDFNARKHITSTSAHYGSDFYNKAVDVQYCIDGGVQWNKYIHKLRAATPLTPEDELFTPIDELPNYFYNIHMKNQK